MPEYVTVSRFLDPLVLVLIALPAAIFRAGRGHKRSAGDALPWWRRQRVAPGVVCALLWILAMPWTADRLAGCVQSSPPDLRAALAPLDAERTALVVLSGGMKTSMSSQPPSERLDGGTQGRVLGAARVYAEKPVARIIVSTYSRESADGMTELLTRLGVPAERIVAEIESVDTKTNAQNSVRLTRELGLDRIVLVTSALHMRRSAWEFSRSGMEVVQAPVDYIGGKRFGLTSFLPSSSALYTSHLALHELAGRLKP